MGFVAIFKQSSGFEFSLLPSRVHPRPCRYHKPFHWKLAARHVQELPGGMIINPLVKVLVMIGSSASIGFGIWHFFVPEAWKWYSYIDVNATELVAAVRAVNAFFSLSLVLFGIVNILLIYGDRSNRYSIMVVLSATCILWLTRVSFQVIYPQGSLYPGLLGWTPLSRQFLGQT